jgi:hypothetical protein
MTTMTDQHITLPLKRFLLIEQCPLDWTQLDLYLFRDENVVFYVGQSHRAFDRVWDHLLGGFKGHSMVGRFMWSNWPVSMKFTIELMSSRNAEFACIGNDLSAAERLLIERWSPCFNISLNSQPTPIPSQYCPANGILRCGRSLNKLIHQAERVVKVDDARLLIEE